MNLSYSKLEQFIDCPFCYKKVYLSSYQSKPQPHFSFGKSIHDALEKYYKFSFFVWLGFIKPNFKRLKKLYKKSWYKEGYPDKETERKEFEHGEKLLKAYYDKFIDGKFKFAYQVEMFFSIPMNGYRLNGFIDRIDRLPDKTFELIDYKTEREMRTQEEVDKDLQMSIYYLACAKILNIYPEKLSLHFIEFNESVSTTRTKEDLPRIEAEVLEIAKNIEEEKEFAPKTNKYCKNCEFRTECGLF